MAELFSDDFTGPAGETLGARPGWTYVAGSGGAIEINDANQLRSNNTLSAGIGYITPDLGTPDHWVRFRFLTNNCLPFVCVRFLSNQTFGAGVRMGADNLVVWQRNAGTYTQLANLGAVPSFDTADEWTLTVTGSTGQMLRNGVAFGSTFTLLIQATRTYAGVVGRTTAVDPWIDDFKAGDHSGGESITGEGTGAFEIAGAGAAVPGVPAAAGGALGLGGASNAAPRVTAAASGFVGLGGASNAAPRVPATASGFVGLGGASNAAPRVPATASGAIGIAGTAASTPVISATAGGSLGLVGLATGATGGGTLADGGGALGLGGIASVTVSVTGLGDGAIGLGGGGAASVHVPATSGGYLTISGSSSSSPIISATAGGTIELSATGNIAAGSGTLAVDGGGSFTLGGSSSADVDVFAVGGGLVALSGSGVVSSIVPADASGALHVSGQGSASPQVPATSGGAFTLRALGSAGEIAAQLLVLRVTVKGTGLKSNVRGSRLQATVPSRVVH